MLDGLEKYIKQQIKEPVYSEVYWRNSVANVINEKFPLSYKVKGIYTNSIFVGYQSTSPITFRDNFGRVLFETIGGDLAFTVAFPFWYYFPGNQIGITASVPAGAINTRFSISFQLITEHKLNR